MARHRPGSGSPQPRRRLAFRFALGLASLAVVGLVYQAAGLWVSWHSLDREAFDKAAFADLPSVPVDRLAAVSDTVLPVGDSSPSADSGARSSAARVAVSHPFVTYLLVGIDEVDQRADLIVLVLLPADGEAPLLVSLPHNLYLPNRCSQRLTELDVNYRGCGPDLNGPTQLAGAITDYTGVEIDHFTLFNTDWFEQVIDALGGIEICVDHPVREETRFELPAGCSLADGTVALGWLRSREAEALVDGRWRAMPEVDDRARDRRQQDLMLDVARQVSSFDSPAEFSRFVASLGDAFTIDDRLSLTGLADLAWSSRHLSPNEVITMTIPAQPFTTSAGAKVLLPTTPFSEVLARHWSPS